MKFIIIGLGHFGVALAEKLTRRGNEVIGVDQDMDKVEMLKERISHTICMDATDRNAVSGLPLKDTDAVIVAIGKDKGANIMITALLKNLGAKKLVIRIIDPLHRNVLEAIGVDEMVNSEQETAERWAKKLCLKGVVDSFELSDEFTIVEVQVPDSYHGKTIEEINIRSQYNLLILTIIEFVEVNSVLGKSRLERKVKGVASAGWKLNSKDVIVVYGSNRDIRNFLKAAD